LAERTFLADPFEEEKAGEEDGDGNPELDVGKNFGEAIGRGLRRAGAVRHEFPFRGR